MKRFDLNWISKYRNELFGIAILSVLFFHFAMLHVNYYKDSNGVLFSLIKSYRVYFSSAGVDIFAFLSGMGLYYSFSANSDIKRFYSRRFQRILIPYFIVGTIFWVQHDIIFTHAGFGRFLLDFSYVTFFTEGVNNLWFIFYIGVMYLIFPPVYRMIFNERYGKLLFVLILTAAIMIPIAMSKYTPELYDNINKAATRVPAFIIGIPAGKYIKNGVKVPHIAVISIIALAFLIRYYAEQNHIKGWALRYIGSCFGLAVMLLCVYFLRVFDGAEFIRKILRFFGKYSLELYLLHILMWEFLGVAAGVPLHKASCYLVMILLSIALAPVLSRLTTLIGQGLRKTGKAESSA